MTATARVPQGADCRSRARARLTVESCLRSSRRSPLLDRLLAAAVSKGMTEGAACRGAGQHARLVEPERRDSLDADVKIWMYLGGGADAMRDS